MDEVKSLCNKMKEKDIEARPFWKPVHLQEPYRGCPIEDTNVTDALWDRIITLPCSTNITDNELETVSNTVKYFLKENFF